MKTPLIVALGVVLFLLARRASASDVDDRYLIDDTDASNDYSDPYDYDEAAASNELPTTAESGEGVVSLVTGALNPVGAVIGYIGSQVMKPRGERNNNPGNIKRNAIRWQGMAADQSADNTFVVFETPEAGIRAMVLVLRAYESRGVDTIANIINTYAPSSENNTAAYIRAVSNATGIGENTPLDTYDRDTMRNIINAIIYHENGRNVFATDGAVERGLEMARGWQ